MTRRFPGPGIGRKTSRGTGRGRPTVAAGLGLGLLAVTMSASSARAAARPLADCNARTGAILAVDFGPWGGPLLRSCGSTPTTGYVLLNQGGWHTAGTVHDGPGFICRIGYGGYRHDAQYPTAAQQACVQTPPAGAYWVSWLAGPGRASWTYSQSGAMSDHPAPGSISLWVFGGTNLSGTTGSAVPTISPQALRTAAPGAGATSEHPAIVDAPPIAASASVSVSPGSAWPTVVAVAIAALLAVAGTAAVARRRRLGRS